MNKNTATSNRKPCINVITATYTGKESSPLRYGLSAEGFDIDYEHEGHDKLIWFVKIKNNKKVWVRKYSFQKITHEEPLIVVNEPIIVNEPPIISNIVIEKSQEVVKKQTDYNLFLTYHLNKLKSENTTNEPNKVLFNKTMNEWKLLKSNPTELKIILNKIKSIQN